MVAIGNGRLFFGSPTPATRRDAGEGRISESEVSDQTKD